MQLSLKKLRMPLAALLAFFAFAFAAFAENSGRKIAAENKVSENAKQSETDALLEGGIKYFMRKDYSSAEQLLKNISEKTPVQYGMAAYYLGSMQANSGDKNAAYNYFVAAVKYAPEQFKTLAALQFAKLADANGDYEKIRGVLEKVCSGIKASNLLDYYFAKARFANASDKAARADFLEKLKSEFNKNDSLFADTFVEDKLDNEPLFDSISANIFPSDSKPAKARTIMMQSDSNKLGAEFENAGFLAKIRVAESGNLKDRASFEADLLKYRNAPFAWRAAYELAKEFFLEQNYEKSLEYAKAAEFLAPPDLRVSWGAVMLCGDSYRMLKKYDDALEYYLKIAMSKVLRGEPLAESLYKCGVCWYELKDWGRAHPYFERVYIVYFKFEYWGARAYYYAASTLLQMGDRRDAAATLLEYFKRAKDKDSKIYKEAKDLYRQQWGGR